jgi:hypothetical protein
VGDKGEDLEPSSVEAIHQSEGIVSRVMGVSIRGHYRDSHGTLVALLVLLSKRLSLNFLSKETAMMTANAQPQMYTLRQAAALFQCSPWTLRMWNRKGKLLTVKTPGGIRIPAAEVARIVAGEKEVCASRN